jgi:cell division protein FtsB
VSNLRARINGLTTGVFANRRRFATGAAAMLAIGVGYHVVFGQNGLTVYQQKRSSERVLQQQMQALRHENDQLKSHVDLLETDPDAIEHQAREELHYTRPGEVIYTLPPDPPAPH